MEVNNGPLEVQFQQGNWIETQGEIFFVQDVPVGFSLVAQQGKDIMRKIQITLKIPRLFNVSFNLLEIKIKQSRL